MDIKITNSEYDESYLDNIDSINMYVNGKEFQITETDSGIKIRVLNMGSGLNIKPKASNVIDID